MLYSFKVSWHILVYFWIMLACTCTVLSVCRPWLYAGNPLSLQLLEQSFIGGLSLNGNTFSTSDNVVGLGNQQGSSNNRVDNHVPNTNGLVMPTSNQNKPQVNSDYTPSLNNADINANLGYWIAGFIEGEGSFNVTFKLKSDLRMGIQVSPEISVTQHVDGKHILMLIKNTFGGIGSGILSKSSNSNVLVYKVTSLMELLNVVIPFLQKYNVYSARTVEFNMLVTVCQMIQNKDHLTVAGMTKIIDLVYATPLSKSNRQFKKSELLDVLGDQQKVADLVQARRQAKRNKANNL